MYIRAWKNGEAMIRAHAHDNSAQDNKDPHDCLSSSGCTKHIVRLCTSSQVMGLFGLCDSSQT